jgi:4-amino-4-deoxy-L-arabinose transferase-like glycosyltransferase
MFFKFVAFSILILALFTRFVGLNWANGYFFHPDENNMATAVSQLSSQNYNPHFFAYGQFPLYLGYFTLKAVNIPNSFSNSVYVLRFWSAVFSSLTIFIIYLISQKLFPQPLTLIVVLLTIFSPGLIQLAHFGTTESLLLLVFVSNIFLAFKIINRPKWIYFIIAGIVSGIGLATKVSSLIFLGPVFLAVLFNLIKNTHRLNIISRVVLFIIITVIFALILSPYNLIESSDFLSSLRYETAVATGRMPVFYTTQFQNTTPYLFQLSKIFPYTSGLPVFILAILGFFTFIKNCKLKIKNSTYWSLLLISSFVYFLYFGQLYTKWTRFVSPLFFIPPLFVVYFISKIKPSFIRYILVVICCLPGIYFIKIYFSPDVRVTASGWIDNNIPADSKIFSEGGNVVNLPLTRQSYRVNNYDFYGNYDPATLAAGLSDSDYILVPSRRIFKNYRFSYYQHLFDGSLGFMEIKRFSPDTDFLLNPENAEETWSVFDRPTIRIYKKVKQLDMSQYETLLRT